MGGWIHELAALRPGPCFVPAKTQATSTSRGFLSRATGSESIRSSWLQAQLRDRRGRRETTVPRRAFDGVAEFLPLLVAVTPALVYQLAGEAKNPIGVPRRKDVKPWAEVMELLTSDVLTRIRKPLVFLNMISAAVFAFNFYILPPGRGNFVFPVEGFVALTFCVGVLLAQRLKTANQRFLRGKKAWSEIVNVTRNLNRQAHLWAERESFLVFSRWLP
eukprot:s1660_g1.t1